MSVSNSSGRLRRVTREYYDIINNPIEGVSAGPRIGERLLPHWDGIVHGPENTPYEGYIFKLSIRFPEAYPFKPPKVRFETKVLHCNINIYGTINLDVLFDRWSPALTIIKVLLMVRFLLDDPNADDPLVPELAVLYKKDREAYNKKVRDAVVEHAVPKWNFDSSDSDS